MSFHRDALLSRRSHLARLLGDRPALVVSGLPRARNYAANAYRFRAASHFLYLVGWNTPGAALLYDGQSFQLFAPLPGPEEALWEGPSPSPAELSERWGLEVRDLSSLAQHLPRGDVATLPGLESDTCAMQSTWLGRVVARGALAACDEPLADALISLRLVQDEAMVFSIREALKVSTRCHLAGMAATSAGVPASRIRAAMEAPMLAANVEPAYGSIVTCHGEVLHDTRYDHLLSAEDLLLADVGAESPEGVASDITRTWPVSGTFSPEAAALYDAVLAAQAQAIATVAPGRRYRDVHLAAMQSLAEGLVAVGLLQGDPAERVADDSVALFFPHGIGHLLGLDVHDMEDLGDRAGYAPGRTRDARPSLRYLRLDRDLVPGMLLTIEPGLYFVPALLDDAETRRKYADRVRWPEVDRFAQVRGIRIEDDVLVTAAGCEVLSAAIPKDRAAIEKAVGATMP